MKIVYDIDPESVIRVDGLIFDVSEFRSDWSNGYAFRGDDREPRGIFQQGFVKRDGNYGVATRGLLSTEFPNTIVNEHVFATERPLPAERDMVYRLGPSEVLLRTQHLDLEKPTCVSTTLDPALATGFPLGGSDYTYLYLIQPKAKKLDTYLIQKHGGRDGLSKSCEVTFNQIPATDVYGAARVKRVVTGIDAMSSVSFEIDTWYLNDGGAPKEAKLDHLLEICRKQNSQFQLKGTKLVGGGAKDEGSKASSNELLLSALKAAGRVAGVLNAAVLDRLSLNDTNSPKPLQNRARAGSVGDKSGGNKGGLPKWL